MFCHHIIALATALVLSTAATRAASPSVNVVEEEDFLIIENVQESEHHNANGERKLRFAWGAEFNGGVEMSGHDMSTVGIDASFGMAWKWIRFLGITAEADIMVDNSSRSFPISLNFRTDFSRKRRLLFMDLRGGMAFNYYNGESQSTDPYASAGLGITLASGKTFSSHIILAYTYLGRKHCYVGDFMRDCPGMSYASMRLGVTF